MLTEDQIVALLKAWDELDAAVQRVECAMPMKLSEAVRDMSGARIDCRHRLQSLMRHAVQS